MKLADIDPHIDAEAMVRQFNPPHRFANATFATYIPDPRYPSQQAARKALQAYANAERPQAKSWWQRKAAPVPRGRYLDGGFGVGKTHLIASLWHQWQGPKAYLTFTELTAFIGFCGMASAVKAFRPFGLICIDEFELDDVAHTLMVVSFLRTLATDSSVRIAVTSNTLPDRLGEQRFSANDFRREITVIASYFEELKIDGTDFRSAHGETEQRWVPDLRPSASSTMTTEDQFDELMVHLRRVHPVRYGALLADVQAVVIRGLHTINEQDDALLFVQLVDKLYDADIPVAFLGGPIKDVFRADYRLGGYRKKYGRAESRMEALRGEWRYDAE